MFQYTSRQSFHQIHGKEHFESLIHLLGYIRDNETLVLNYDDDMKDKLLSNLLYDEIRDEYLSDLFRQAIIRTDNQLIFLLDYSWQDFQENYRSTGSYIIFDQGGPIDIGTHVSVSIAQSSVESEYNAACNVGMDSAHFRILIHELLN